MKSEGISVEPCTTINNHIWQPFVSPTVQAVGWRCQLCDTQLVIDCTSGQAQGVVG